MRVFVNSKEHEIAAGATVQSLLEALNLAAQRVAVEVNAQLVARAEWPRFRLKEGDRVEVVSFVGGG